MVKGEADKEPEAEGAKPMKRTRKQKRPLPAAVEREEEERAEAHTGSNDMKRPAAAPTKARTSAAAPQAASKDAPMAVPSNVARPPWSQNPTPYAGGRIYFSKLKNAYRVYLRKGDRIEKCVKANAGCDIDMADKFDICCSLIENDPRPVCT